ncbi:GTP-binding protein [Paraburkholderia bengalensis]|uniref:GTP-binding protein n=1 Tax=Paraburkholderia bengalensis TaxID=2747562 RepID=A0ABU8J1Z0_9BURK
MKRLAAVLCCVATLVAVDIAPSRAAFEVQGMIIDESTHQPIPYATVTLDGKPQYADANGAFSSAGAVHLVAARAPGYRSASVSLTPEQPLVVRLAPFRARGVYLSVYGVASRTLRDAAVALKDTNGINALVIDAKGDRGLTSYASDARESIGAAANAPSPAPVVHDMAALLQSLHRDGLYLIARIVVFKDDPLASAHPEWSVQDAQGNAWRDREQLQWVDPFRREVWDHNLDVAEEAARLGFDEIQFNYVRFPDAPGLVFSKPNTRANRTAAIAGFLTAARARLAPYNVFVAADIFGYVCWNLDDTAVGQQLETFGTALDYISPMLYPSGFTWGLPGCTKPTADPGQIVRRSLAEAQRRTGLPGVRFRPWLQAFRDYAFDHREFDADEIRAQIDAADAEHTDGWMLWNPRNRYDPTQLPH